MLSYLKGKVVETIPANASRATAIIEVNSIGYEVQVPSSFARELEKNPTEEVQIFTHWQVREEQTILYGFPTGEEREVFRLLIGISGIGPQIAIALLDNLGLSQLTTAIHQENLRLLCKTPGVGQKTAERLILELKHKLKLTLSSPGKSSVIKEVESTLTDLGYSDKEIDQAVEHLLSNAPPGVNLEIESALTSAISLLAGF